MGGLDLRGEGCVLDGRKRYDKGVEKGEGWIGFGGWLRMLVRRV